MLQPTRSNPWRLVDAGTFCVIATDVKLVATVTIPRLINQYGPEGGKLQTDKDWKVVPTIVKRDAHIGRCVTFDKRANPAANED